MSISTLQDNSSGTRVVATLVDSESTVSNVRVFGLSARERLLRTFERLEISMIEPCELAQESAGRVVAIGAGYFYDERLIAALAEQSEDLILSLDSHGGDPIAVVGSARMVDRLLPVLRGEAGIADATESTGVVHVAPTDLVPAFNSKLRKYAPPFVISASECHADEARARIFDASYKGTTDFVTKWVWPRPARAVTSWCADRGIRPNTVTGIGYILTFISLFAFWEGAFAIGLLSAWLMTFLDTVDGKLARVTLTSSRLGDVLDHGLDLVHPPFWWVAWLAGLAEPGVLSGDYLHWAWVVFAAYVVGRLLEGLFILLFGQEMFTWRPFDASFRLVIARRNPNLVVLTAATLLGRPDLGIMIVVVWTVACCLIQCVRIGQAKLTQRSGHSIESFQQ